MNGRTHTLVAVMRLATAAAIALGSLLWTGCHRRTAKLAVIPPSLPKIAPYNAIDMGLGGACENGTAVMFGSCEIGHCPIMDCPQAESPVSRPVEPILTASGESDLTTGTIVVVSASQHKIVLAADSRSLHYHSTGAYSDFSDESCKIAVLGPRLAFAVTGISGNYSPSLPEAVRVNAFDVAEQLSLPPPFHFGIQPPPPPPHETTYFQNSVQQLAKNWGITMSQRFLKGISIGAVPPPLKNSKQLLVQGIFVGSDENGDLQIAATDVMYGAPRDGWYVSTASPNTRSIGLLASATITEVFGQTKVAFSYVAPSFVTERTLKDYERLVYAEAADPRQFDERTPIALVKKTIRSDPTRAYPNGPKVVGGPVDAVVMTKGGEFKWLVRKPNCPEKGVATREQPK